MNASSGAYHLQLVKHEPSVSEYFPNHFLVNTPYDLQPADDGQLSLREAVELAGSRPGRDLIEFAAGMGSTPVELRWGPLSITADTVIRGNATSGTGTIQIARSALADSAHYFEIAAGAHLVLEKLALDGAQATGDGGAILVDGQLELDTVSIEHSTATRGAALFVGAGGSASVYGSTLAQNTASDSGGAAYVAAGGTLSIINSTVSTNQAGQGGAVTNLGTAAFLNATIAQNTATLGGAAAGIDSSGTTYLRNTLIGQHSQGSDLVGSVASLGFNVVGNAQDATGLDENIGDRFGGVGGQAALSVGIGPLQNNGGLGRTHQLLVGSPAIDLGNRFGLSEKDERGAPRLLDGPDLSSASNTVRQNDAGAFEFGGIFLTTTADGVNAATAADGKIDADTGHDDDDITLRAALQEIREISQPRADDFVPQVRFESEIIVPERFYLLQTTLLGSNDDVGASGDLDIVGDVTITAPSASSYSISGDYDSDRVLHVHQGSRLALNSINVEGGRAVRGPDGISKGGGILNDGGTLELRNATFNRGPGTPAISDISANMADRGAGIYTRNGSVLIESTRMTYGAATWGGALYVESGNVSITDLQLDHNIATEAGGALYIAGGSLVADGMVVEDNQATPAGIYTSKLSQGSGIFTSGGNSRIAHLSLQRNSRYYGSPGSNDWGGGLYNAGTLFLSDATLGENGLHDFT
ncbi:MAG: choice-of-anchor Q domain-containing protein, partial [Aureliella sp.]